MISVMRRESQNPVMTMNLQCRCHIKRTVWWIEEYIKNRAVKTLHGLVSVIIKAKKTLLYKNISVCFGFLSVSERRCVMYYILKYKRLAPLSVLQRLLSHYLRTNTERTINILSSFYLRKPLSNTPTRKALHYTSLLLFLLWFAAA